MTYFQIGVTYVICWFMVIFMVLPHRADPPENPVIGHAPSAPENPRIGRKMWWTTWLAIIPCVAFYFIINVVEAKAEDSIYHAGGCKPVAPSADANLMTTEGTGASGHAVKPATIPSTSAIDLNKINIGLDLPTAKYDHSQNSQTSGTSGSGSTNTTSSNPSGTDLSDSYIGLGKMTVGKDGSATLNGKPLATQPTPPEGCN
jgi:predicted secreted protein